MADFTSRPDTVNVEQIMDQIRARIRDKRGVDYTEQQVQELAKARLEHLLEPRALQSDLLDQFKKLQPAYQPPQLPAYEFEDSTLYESHRGPLRAIRRFLQPILKLFFNPNPLIQALHTQARLNAMYAERESKREAMRLAAEQLYFERVHSLVVEITRASLELKTLRMRVESMGGRLEFNERRARNIESAVVYKPSGDDQRRRERDRDRDREREQPQPQMQRQQAPASVEPFVASPVPAATAPEQQQPQQQQPGAEGTGQRRRRRRRRGRRGGGGAQPGAPGLPQAPQQAGDAAPVAKEDLETFAGAALHPTEFDEGDEDEAEDPEPPVEAGPPPAAAAAEPVAEEPRAPEEPRVTEEPRASGTPAEEPRRPEPDRGIPPQDDTQ